jgi:1,4-alpha-glucan branching enzyme
MQVREADPRVGVRLGAVPHGVGTFRAWSPNASAVSVAGDFNGWDAKATPPAHEGVGVSDADVPDAHARRQYEYVLTTPAETLTRIDPCARAVTHSAGVVYNRWKGDDTGFAGQPSYDLDARSELGGGMPFSGDLGIRAHTAIVLSQDD